MSRGLDGDVVVEPEVDRPKAALLDEASSADVDLFKEAAEEFASDRGLSLEAGEEATSPGVLSCAGMVLTWFLALNDKQDQKRNVSDSAENVVNQEGNEEKLWYFTEPSVMHHAWGPVIIGGKSETDKHILQWWIFMSDLIQLHNETLTNINSKFINPSSQNQFFNECLYKLLTYFDQTEEEGHYTLNWIKDMHESTLHTCS